MSSESELPRTAPQEVEARPLDEDVPRLEVRERGCVGSLLALTGVVLGTIYIANPGFGLLELIPDNAPVIGNLDEAGATALLIMGLQYLFGRGRRG
jgi:hypothetical protein